MTWVTCACLALLGLDLSESPIKPDETVLFFPSIGRLLEDGSSWKIAIHGWIFEREEDSAARAALIDVIREAIGLEEGGSEPEILKRRLQPFLADSERGKIVSIRLGVKEYALEESEPSGHFRGTITLAIEEAWKLLRAGGGQIGGREEGGRLAFDAVVRNGDDRFFRGEAWLLGASGTSVISDIDDTIKVSGVLDKKALLRNTLLRELRAVPGMADLYSAWARMGTAFHYVSASPWQLFEPLLEFVTAAGFPRGTFHMKQFRLKDSTFFDLFVSPVDYKRGHIDPLIESFPKRGFVLVGDSGEKDPEIYGAVARKYPAQVKRILIRDVTGEGAGSGRMKKAFEGVPVDRWQVFREAGEVARP